MIFFIEWEEVQCLLDRSKAPNGPWSRFSGWPGPGPCSLWIMRVASVTFPFGPSWPLGSWHDLCCFAEYVQCLLALSNAPNSPCFDFFMVASVAFLFWFLPAPGVHEIIFIFESEYVQCMLALSNTPNGPWLWFWGLVMTNHIYTQNISLML